MTEMDLGVDEAYSFLLQMSGKTFGEIFTSEIFSQFSSKSKGKSGDMIETLLGKSSDSAALDFYDGELKSYAADGNSIPLDVVKIKMITQQVDWMLNVDGCTQDYYWGTPFAEKLSQILFAPILKASSNENDWTMLCPFLISQYDAEWQWLYERFAQDLYDICATIQDDVYNGNYRSQKSELHGAHLFSSTSSKQDEGRYLFIKPAGSGKTATYTSDGTMVASSQYALYMTKLCIRDILGSMYYDPYYAFIDEYEGDEYPY